MSGRFHSAFLTLVGMAPACRLKNRLLTCLGWSIHPDAVVKPCLFIRTSCVTVATRASIGSFNVFRGLITVELGQGALVGQLNWISVADTLLSVRQRRGGGYLILEQDSAITNRHYIDCTGGVLLRAFSTLAGVRSTILTHAIDVVDNRQVASGCEIGQYSLVSSNAKLVPGARIPNKSIVAMGAVVAKGLSATHQLYAGVPARAVRQLPPEADYFKRSQGPVGPGTGVGTAAALARMKSDD